MVIGAVGCVVSRARVRRALADDMTETQQRGLLRPHGAGGHTEVYGTERNSSGYGIIGMHMKGSSVSKVTSSGSIAGAMNFLSRTVDIMTLRLCVFQSGRTMTALMQSANRRPPSLPRSIVFLTPKEAVN